MFGQLHIKRTRDGASEGRPGFDEPCAATGCDDDVLAPWTLRASWLASWLAGWGLGGLCTLPRVEQVQVQVQVQVGVLPGGSGATRQTLVPAPVSNTAKPEFHCSATLQESPGRSLSFTQPPFLFLILLLYYLYYSCY